MQFTGTYENQLRAEKTLSVVVPLALAIIFLILYFQFRSVGTSLMVFTGIAVAFAGGFIMIWLYGQGLVFKLQCRWRKYARLIPDASQLI